MNDTEQTTEQIIASKDAEIARLKAALPKPEINTHVRMFDLVRYSRAELHEAELITDEEYSWLCSSLLATSPKGGSPSRKRLEDYDELRAQMKTLESENATLRSELDAAKDDSAMLDWLEEKRWGMSNWLDEDCERVWLVWDNDAGDISSALSKTTLRAAIADAMKASSVSAPPQPAP